MVKTLFINKTNNSPEVLLDAERGIINLSGASFLEDSVSFYAPIMEWIDESNKNPKDFTVNVELTYFNSSAAKILITAIKTLKVIVKNNFKLTVNWVYSDDDEDIRDSGLDFSKLTGIPFNMIEK